MKILIIDDSEDDRLMYRRALQKDTRTVYDILEAADGTEGLSHLQGSAPECILLDYSLPGHNGIEVLKRIREQHTFAPVVMMTGQGSEAIAVQAIHEGAQNYIPKSIITPETLQHAVYAAIEHCKMEKRIHDQRNALEIFSRALAHDLKEPIRTIKSFMDLLEDHQNFSDEERGYFNYIQKAANRMGDLVEMVYFYTRLDSIPQQSIENVCDVGTILQEAKENIKQLMDERAAVITGSDLPQVYINPIHLLQVLQNLLCNAINHSEAQPKIEVHATKRADGWLLQVSDNGPGIPESYRAQIFEPFRRMGRNKEQGLGLGLAVCKKIVESYGGKIWYEPGTGGGSRFLFTLPGSDTVADAYAPITNSISQSASDESTGEFMARLMLVEDNEADIMLTKILLIDKGKLQCHLSIAHDGLEALEMLQASGMQDNRIDLMLLDINMPGMDGFTLLEKLRTDQTLRDIPVVMCSTSNDDKDIERAKSLGAIGYMNKPPRMDKLKSFIEHMPSIHLRHVNDGYVLMRAV